jgi:tRNA (adenine57-N1/adenine58-N1)-methyltransferase
VILLVREDREYLREPGDVLETDLGVLEIPENPTPGEVLRTHLGTGFTVRELRGPDFARHFRRSGAPMLPRDIGLVIGHTGVGAGDRVLDAGTGTGVLAAYLGRLGADVLTYERDPEAAAVARENMALAEVSEVVDVREGDVLDAVEEPLPGTGSVRADSPDSGSDSDGDGKSDDGEANGENATDAEDADAAERSVDGERDIGESGGRFDLLTLDTADAPAVLERAPELLVPGGFCAVYSPFVESARDAVETAREAGLAVDTYETIQRELDVDERGTRPTTAGVGHTGFLSICRHE